MLRHFEARRQLAVVMAAIAAVFWVDTSSAQTPVSVSGNLSLYGESYTQSGLERARRAPTTGSAYGQVNVTLFNQIVLPVTLYGSTEGFGYQHPFNQFGISPEYRWIKAHGGYFSTQLSELTLADARILGGGLELSPGPVRVAAVSGYSQRAVEANAAEGLTGLYRRRLSAGQIGLGQPGGAHLWISALQARDDLTSVSDAGVLPEENVVTSLRFSLPLFQRKFVLTGEAGASAYSSDITADSLEIPDEYVDLARSFDMIFTPRTSSRVDGAAIASVTVAPTNAFAVSLQGRYVGPGFRSLGAMQLENDVLDFLVAPRTQGKWGSAAVRFGLRQNNVAGTRISTTQRLLADANTSVRLSNNVSVNAQYTNFGLKASAIADTLRISNISQLINLSPVVSFSTGNVSQSAMASYSFQNYTDRTVLGGRETDSRNHNATIAHSASWPSGFVVSTTASYTQGLTADLDSKIITIAETVSHRLLKSKLQLSAGTSYSRIQSFRTDQGLSFQVRASYRVTPSGAIEFGLNGRSFRYGETVNGSEGYTEVQTRLGYSMSF